MNSEIIAKVREISAKYKITPTLSDVCKDSVLSVGVTDLSCSNTDLDVLPNHLDRDFLKNIRDLKHLIT